MIIRYPRTGDADGPEKEKKTGEHDAEHHAKAGKDDDCRCKEVSEKTPRQLLGIMFNDLAFWKKLKKG
jgi:hypothetical protein